MKKAMFTIMTIVIMIISSCSGSSDPSNTIKDFYSALSQQNEQKALSYIYVEENNKIEKGIIMIFVNMAVQQGFKFKDFKTVSKEITDDGKSAIVAVEVVVIKEENGKEEFKKDLTTYGLIKIDNKWKIEGIKMNK